MPTEMDDVTQDSSGELSFVDRVIRASLRHRLVVLVGTPRAVGIAVRNRDVAHRNTMLAERLRGETALGLTGGLA